MRHPLEREYWEDREINWKKMVPIIIVLFSFLIILTIIKGGN